MHSASFFIATIRLRFFRSADVAPLHFLSSKFETTVDRHFLSISTVNRSEATTDAANIQSSLAFFCRRCHPTPPTKPQPPFFRRNCVTRDRHYLETIDSSPTTSAKGKFSGGFDIGAFGGLQGEKVAAPKPSFVSVEILTDIVKASRKPSTTTIDDLALGGGLCNTPIFASWIYYKTPNNTVRCGSI
nr:glyoxysomal fatty acid beta-oxidation multifunctional protein MFP-A [Ipomoea batatas]